MAELICKNCKRVFLDKKQNHRKKYCSKECRAEALYGSKSSINPYFLRRGEPRILTGSSIASECSLV